MEDFDHVVHIDARKNTLSIFRKFKNDSQVLFTEVDLRDFKEDLKKENFKKLASELGENILLDSPAARKIFKL